MQSRIQKANMQKQKSLRRRDEEREHDKFLEQLFMYSLESTMKSHFNCQCACIDHDNDGNDSNDDNNDHDSYSCYCLHMIRQAQANSKQKVHSKKGTAKPKVLNQDLDKQKEEKQDDSSNQKLSQVNSTNDKKLNPQEEKPHISKTGNDNPKKDTVSLAKSTKDNNKENVEQKDQKKSKLEKKELLKYSNNNDKKDLKSGTHKKNAAPIPQCANNNKDKEKLEKTDLKMTQTKDNEEAEKLEKKKLKKQKQKARRAADKMNAQESTQNQNQETSKPLSIEKSSDPIDVQLLDNSTSDFNTSDSIKENEIFEETILDQKSAFMQSAIKGNKKLSLIVKNQNQRKVPNVVDKDDQNSIISSMENHDESGQDFTDVKHKRSKHAAMKSGKTSKILAVQGIRMVMKNKLSAAINHFSEAISIDPNDARHYVNKSFCHLRSGHYSQALNDSEYAMTLSDDITVLTKAQCISAQALSLMKDYEMAVKRFRESLNFSPKEKRIRREIMRVKIDHLLEMGFIESDAILALQKNSTIASAIELLINREGNESNQSKFDDFIYEHDVFTDKDGNGFCNTDIISDIITNEIHQNARTF